MIQAGKTDTTLALNLPEKSVLMTLICDNQRITWIDSAKGVGVILVVMGHLWYSAKICVINQVIYAFHVPMFFILSGSVFHVKGDILQWLLGRFKRILMPIIIYNILYAAVYIFIGWDSLDISFVFDRFFYLHGKCYHNSPSWFFITLMIIYFVFSIFRMYSLNILSLSLTALISFVGGYCLYSHELFQFLGLDRVVICSGFFAVGMLFRRARDLWGKYVGMTKIGYIMAMLIFVVLLALFGVVLNTKVSLYGRDLGIYPAFVLSGISGTVLCCLICGIIRSQVILERLKRYSQHSILIIGTHYCIAKSIRSIAETIGVAHTLRYDVFAVIITLIILELYCLIGDRLNKVAPVLTGQSGNITKK